MNARVLSGVLGAAALLALGFFWGEGTPPDLLAEFPVGPAAGPLIFSATASDDRTGVAGVTLRGPDGQHPLSFDGERWTVTRPAPADGEHPFALCATDRSLRHNERCVDATVIADNTPPALTLAGGEGLAQGGAAGFVVRTSEPLATVWARFDGRAVTLAPQPDAPGVYRGFLGAGVGQEPGPSELVVSGVDAAGLRQNVAFELAVAKTTFPDGGYVQLSPERAANMKNDTKRAFDREQRAAAYARPQEGWLLDEPIAVPTAGRVSSPFGKVRTYNTGVVRHHLGTDIAAPRGQPVVASAAGVVALAEELPIHGGAVVLRHAPDVSSSYNHLSVISVEVGQTVAAGEVVGEVGSTGQSTGPHLHWGFVVGGVAVAPEQWTVPERWPGAAHTGADAEFRAPSRQLSDPEADALRASAG